MKKIWWKTGVVLALLCQLTACNKIEQKENALDKQEKNIEKSENEEKISASVTHLVWENDQGLKEHQEYFNQLLREKNLPYEVEFIDYVKSSGTKADIKELVRDWGNIYDGDTEVRKGEFIPLDDYLNSESGKIIKESVNQSVWDAFQIDKKQYTVLSMGFIPTKVVYIWDKQLAQKYGIHPEEWNEKIWEYEEELKKVKEGEKGNSELIILSGLDIYGNHLKGNTEALGICYPIVVNEEEEKPVAEYLFETVKYKEYRQGLKALCKSGVYRPELENENDSNFFLKIYDDFKTKDAFLADQDKNFWQTHDMKEIWEKPLWRIHCGVTEVGISSQSSCQKEAFSLLCELYRDVELTNALMWGEEGRNYQLSGNTAVIPVTGEYLPASYVGNNFMAYCEKGQDENKKEVYPKLLDECKDSKIKGFSFRDDNCKDELDALYQAWEEDPSDMSEDQDKLIKRYKDAGIDQVIAEWNRQFQEWTKNKK